MEEETLALHPIGYIKTMYNEKYHTPRQPGIGKEHSTGIITLLPNKNFEQALEDLSGFERIWILFWFHKNKNWKPKVLPPRSGRTKKGLFSTRSPHRPNPIGLSLCTLVKVEGCNIFVEDPDLLDGTPILDIKPYIPYADAFPDSKVGWISTVQDEHAFEVTVRKKTKTQAAWLAEKFDIHFLERAVDVLSHDPMPHSYRRIMKHENGGYVIALKSWRVLFDVKGRTVTITSIESGYPAEAIREALLEKKELHHQDAHIAFRKMWHQ